MGPGVPHADSPDGSRYTTKAGQSRVLGLETTMDGEVADVLQVIFRGKMEVLPGVAICDDEELLNGPVATISGGIHHLHLSIDLSANE
jgi:hypothetical protein